MALAILDIDGTLVDTNYQHALAWYRAFRSCGIQLQVWRIHRHIGMGGDQLVRALTDAEVDREKGDEIRANEAGYYGEMIGEVAPMEGSRELIVELDRRGHEVVLASSAKPEEVEHYLDLLDARSLARAWTSSGDVSATKPHPELIIRALEKVDASAAEAVMVGDSPWDAQAASRAQVPTLAVMTGGFAREELVGAGAREVFESVAQLREELDRTPLR
ncbi:MAG TPA: HAD family hydrolase [Solirubrobacteraceae bacterium]|nr:HAD family hydrolase [Solirubrobacteraceae bacterium]